METATKKFLKGGAFLIEESSAGDVYIPEDITEEQQMFRQTAQDFINQKIWPNVERIDHGDHGLVVHLLNEAGELGLLGTALPEKFGGMGVGFNTETILSEVLGASHSFGVAVAAHTGIGTLPILYFGTEEQKAKYLPGMANGRLKAAYCLTEPGSGSDALAAKTKAIMSEDGKHYLITGQKMWITNSGFADLFIVFAKIDGEKFTGFIVDAASENINLGAEEDKMGIKGSSTRQVFFENVKVPVENVLGEIGKGHRIAFNVLNIGRFKLGAMVTGGAKAAASVSVKYANERHQFGQAISNFGAIKHKLAEQAIKIYASEAAVYRTSGMIKDMIDSLESTGKERYLAKLEAAEEYSVECAILKVLSSEMLDYVVDEAVQVYGGMGFSEESPVARAYRDSRINRIFEGTNEINRLLSVGQLMKKAMKGQLDLMSPAMAIQKELMSVPDFGSNGSGETLGAERHALKQAKKAVLMVAGAAVQKFMQDLEKEQEIVMSIADMLIDLYAAESTILRTTRLVDERGEEAASLYVDMTRCYLTDSMERVFSMGKRALAAFAEGDELRMMMLGLKRFTKYEIVDTIAARRRVAEKLIAEDRYCF